MGPTWGPSGADRTQVTPMLAPWNLLSGKLLPMIKYCKHVVGMGRLYHWFLNTSWAVGLIYWILHLHFLYFDICNYICLDTSYHFLALFYFLNILYFFKYSCTNTFHIRSLNFTVIVITYVGFEKGSYVTDINIEAVGREFGLWYMSSCRSAGSIWYFVGQLAATW